MINNKIAGTDKETADQMVEDLIKMISEEQISKYKEFLHNGDLDNRGLLNYNIKYNGFNELLGIYMMFPNYEVIQQKYGQYLSNKLNDYLKIKFEKENQPLFMDAALIITLDDFVNRIANYENFLLNYPDSKYSDEIRDDLKIMLEIFIYPNRDNIEMFRDNDKPLEKVVQAYKDLIAHGAIAPISKTVGERLLNVVENSPDNSLKNIDLQKLIKDTKNTIDNTY